VEFNAPVSGTVELRMYSLNGQLLNSVSRDVNFGEYVRLDVDARNLANGIYLFQLVTRDGVYAQKAAVLR
jgi:hypothetical protein